VLLSVTYLDFAMATHTSEISPSYDQTRNPVPHVASENDDSSSSLSVKDMSLLDNDSLIHSPLSSTSRDFLPSNKVDPPLDLFAPFKPQHRSSEDLPTAMLDVLLTTCNNSEFDRLWSIRLSRHESWCRQSLDEHMKQLTIINHGSSQRLWSIESSLSPRCKPISPQAPKYTLYETSLAHKIPNITGSLSSRPSRLDAGQLQPWYRYFMLGCKSTDDRSLYDRAHEIVTTSAWHSKTTMQLLADQFLRQYCAQYREPWLSDGARFIIPFMVSVRSCFQKRLELHVANRFQRYVRQSAMGTFKLMWNSVCSVQIFRVTVAEIVIQDQSCCVPSPDSTVTSSDIKQALALSRYVGALYRSSFLDDFDIQTAVSDLLEDPKVIEQIHALHYLITEAGDRLWETADSRRAMVSWSKRLESEVFDPAAVIYSAETRSPVVTFELNRWVNVCRTFHNITFTSFY
jgi:hypothetical protein